MSVQQIKNDIAAYGIAPNKALGQNFLADESAAMRIAETACEGGLPVLEIGPGLGALTGALLDCAPGVAAVEIDETMCAVLASKFGGNERFRLVHCDFLKAELPPIHAFLGGGAFAVAGNLPYYITTPISMRLVASDLPIARMVLMVQREAAAHFTAKPGTGVYSPLAALSQYYYSVSTLFTLPPSSYYPEPRVDSCVLLLERREGVPFEPAFLPLLQRAFAMRRKTLVNNLRASGAVRAEIEDTLARMDLSPSARAEAITPAQLAALARALPV